MPLTALAISRAKPADKSYKMADGGGLYLLVAPTNSFWRLDYRFGGKRKTLSIGPLAVVDLASARRAREASREMLAKGIDPGAAKAAEKSAAKISAGNTFRVLAEEWREKRVRESISEATKFKEGRLLENHAYPAFGDTPITEIRATDVLGPIRKLERLNHLTAANKLRSVVRRIFAYAIVTERADRNPAADLAEAVLPVRSEHYAAITDPLEVGHLMLAIQGYKGGAPTRLGLQFLAHTFVRTIEMRSLDKSWIDWPEKVIRYPPGIMKRKRPHIVPMSRQVVRILEEACDLDLPGTLVFPGVKGIRSKMSENTINQAIRRLGYSNEEHTGHGFRRTASTTLNESGKFNHDWIERQLAHVEENKIRGAYNAAEYLPQRTAMMQWYSDWLDARAAVADVLG